MNHYIPTDEDIAFYNDHGWWVSPPLFSDDEISDLFEASIAFYMHELAKPPVPGLEKYRPREEGWDRLRKDSFASFFHAGIAQLTRAPILGEIAARLAGTSGIRLWHDQLLYKPSKANGNPSNVGWHTDRQYWRTCTSTKMLTAWIPFHDVDERTGTITFMDGSHRWPEEVSAALNFFSNDLNGMEAELGKRGYEVVKIPACMRAGQVSFHGCLTVHGSGANLSGLPRRSIAVHLQDLENSYQPGDHHGLDDLVRRQDGIPDYSDPVLCPVLWSE
jgi:hypothetical protein